MTLTEEIEALRQDMILAAAHETAAVMAVRDALLDADVELMRTLQSVMSEHEARRTDIVAALQQLAHRVGYAPRSLETHTRHPQPRLERTEQTHGPT